MKKNLLIFGVILLLILLSFFVWFLIVRPQQQIDNKENLSLKNNFESIGNVVKNNPGFKPDTWYLIYDVPGAAGSKVELNFNKITDVLTLELINKLSQGERVKVNGQLEDGVLFVNEILKETEVQSSGNTEQVVALKLFLYDPQLDQGPGGVECSKKGIVGVDRIIPKTVTPLKDSLNLLLRGEISEAEKARGLTTNFPLQGLSLENVVVNNGVATLTFKDELNKTSGGSCRVAIIWSQIESTVKQFSNIKEVVFKPDYLFQP